VNDLRPSLPRPEEHADSSGWPPSVMSGSVERSGRLELRSDGCAVPAIALGPAHDPIRHRLGDVRPNTPGSPTTTIRQPSRGSDRPARCNRAATSVGSGGPRRAETGRHPPARIRSKPARGAGSRMSGLGTAPTPDSQRRGSNPRGGTPDTRSTSGFRSGRASGRDSWRDNQQGTTQPATRWGSIQSLHLDSEGQRPGVAPGEHPRSGGRSAVLPSMNA